MNRHLKKFMTLKIVFFDKHGLLYIEGFATLI